MTPEEIRQIGMMLEEYNRETISSVSEIRQSIDMVLGEHRKLARRNGEHVDSWARGFHDGLVKARRIAWRGT